MKLFELQALCKYYHEGSRTEVRALEEISLDIERGAVVAVTGPSGSGKTTLLTLLGVLERPTRGRVLLEGQDLSRCWDGERARLRRRMGFVFQDFSLIPSLTITENIEYALIPRGVERKERRRRMEALLARLGLQDRRFARARELSGGEQQRAAIVRALAGEPDIILADEPTSNLDARTSQTLLELLKEAADARRTVIISSHDPRAVALASQTITLDSGRCVADPPL